MISALCLSVCVVPSVVCSEEKDMTLAGRLPPERPEPQHLTPTRTHRVLATFIHCKIKSSTYGYHKFKQTYKFLCHSFEFLVVTPLGLTLVLIRS